MIASAWLRTLLSRKVKSPVRRGRLAVETLEDRCLLSFGTLTSLSDSAFGFSTYGQNVTFTASVTSNGFAVPEGAVTFYSNGVALLNPVPVNSFGQASFYTTGFFAGFHTITATYSDSLGNFASSSGSDYLSVNPAPLTCYVNSFTTIYGQPPPALTFVPNVATIGPFVNGDTTATALTTVPTFTTDAASFGNVVGTYPIVGSGGIAPNYTISYVNGTLTITLDNTATSLGTYTTTGTTPNSTFSFGQTMDIVAGVAGGHSAASTLAGSVAFYDGSTLLGTVPLGAGGVAGATAFVTSNLAPGVHTLTGVYSGDANHTGSTSPSTTITVAPPPNGVVSGTCFRDYNCNGIQDPGEPGIPGLTMFVDLDNSSILKSGDPMAITDANGNYQITGVPYGTYAIRQVVYGGMLLSHPAGSSAPQGQATLTATQNSVVCNACDVYTSIAVPLTLPPTTPFLSQGNSNADYVEGLYRAILDRDADPSGLANWTAQLNNGSASRLQVVKGIRNSVENFTREVTDFYQTLLNRAPDSAGLQSWVQQLQAGMREEQIAFYFLDSPEYLSQGDKHFVDAMYTSLLGRSFDSAGEATWLNQLAAGTTHQQVVTDFLYSTESLQRLTEGYYETFLQRQADPAGLNGWVGNLQTGTPFLTTGQLFLASDEFYNRAASQG